MATNAVVHEVDRAAHLLAHTTVLASVLTLHAAQAVVARVGHHSQDHFAEICAVSVGLASFEQPDYLNNRL
jgi:hypothetical protein